MFYTSKRSLKLLGVVLIALNLFGCGGGNDPESSSQVNPKIINGVPVDPVVSPQIVEVVVNEVDGTQSLCSGTVIGYRDVLTAAHCINNGSTVNIRSQGVSYGVESTFVAPGYFVDNNVNAIFSDVAVVRTTSPLNLSALSVIASRPVEPDSDLTVFGYGLDENGEFGALKAGGTKASIVTENHIFGPLFNGSGTNSCNGDSGGPAVQSFTDETGALVVGVVGMVSTGTSPSCTKNDVTLFTNLQNPGVLSFLVSVTPEIVIR